MGTNVSPNLCAPLQPDLFTVGPADSGSHALNQHPPRPIKEEPFPTTPLTHGCVQPHTRTQLSFHF